MIFPAFIIGFLSVNFLTDTARIDIQNIQSHLKFLGNEFVARRQNIVWKSGYIPY